MIQKKTKIPTIGQISINTFLLNSENRSRNLVIWSNFSCLKIIKLFQSKYYELFPVGGRYCLLESSSSTFKEFVRMNGIDESIPDSFKVLDLKSPIETQFDNFEFGEDSFLKTDQVLHICRRSRVNFKETQNSFKYAANSESNENLIGFNDLLKENVKSIYPWDTVHSDDNLVSLTHLTQELVLKKLYNRFRIGCFYSYIDNILVFINPYCLLPIYNPKYCNFYRKNSFKSLPPHVYGLTGELYYTMIEQKINQCILISGESGSGKTETSKQIIRQITFLNEYGNFSNLISSIMVSSTVLEAFGNAKNSQNINSSRFGNLTEIFFSKDGLIICAKLRIYMLEKSRIVSKNTNETNFHIFYYMISDLEEQPDLKEEFEYIKSDFDYRSDKYENKNELKKLKNCLSQLNFCQETQNQLFSILLAILHIGNIENKESETNNGNSLHLKRAAELLCIDIDKFNKILTTLSFELLGEKINLDFSASQIKAVKDSIAKTIYSFLFEWIVYRINYELKAHIVIDKLSTNSIKILDILGFENSRQNSFEEFCVNYVNECMQNFLNKKTLKIQQDEYIEEGLEWNRISYVDNTPVVELYVLKPYGLFNLLQDECKLREGSDAKLLDKMNIFHRSNSHYSGVGLKNDHFMVKHYAGPVTYDIRGFRKKNINEINKNIIKLLKESNCSLLRAILTRRNSRQYWNVLKYVFCFVFGIQKKQKNSTIIRRSEETVVSTDNLTNFAKNMMMGKRISAFSTSYSHQSVYKTSHKNRKKKQISDDDFQQNQLYISNYFQKSMAELSEVFSQCQCYFVKCIKSNNNSSPLCFDYETVSRQMRYTGIVQTILIRQAGYSYRFKKSEFFEKYKIIFKNSLSDLKISEFFEKNNIYNETYKIGKTMIFLKDPGIEILGRMKIDIINKMVIILQNKIRLFLNISSICTSAHSNLEIIKLFLETSAKLFSFRKYKIAERDKFVIYEAKKIIEKRLPTEIKQKSQLSTESEGDLQKIDMPKVLNDKKSSFSKRVRCFSSEEHYRKSLEARTKPFSVADKTAVDDIIAMKERSTSTDTNAHNNVLNAQSEIGLEDSLGRSKPLVLFTKKFWISKIKPGKDPNLKSNLFAAIIKESKPETGNSEIGRNLSINSDLILLKTEHELFSFYTFLNQKISELNDVQNSLKDSFLKNNHADNYFAGCLSSFIATLFMKFKICVQNNNFVPITTKEIYQLFEDSVSKYSVSDQDENAAQIVFKNALYGIICDFMKKRKSLFRKKSFEKLINQLKESEFKIEGHFFESYKIYANSSCEICNENIWENALICNECKMLIHRNCRNYIRTKCRIKSFQTEDKKFFSTELINVASFKTPIPPKFWELLEQIEERGCKMEGIYRISGNIKKTKEIIFFLDNVQNQELSFLQDVNPHILASIVKYFLRHLPSPIIPQEFSIDVSNSSNLKKPEMVRRFWKIFGCLSALNKMILDHFSRHLAKIATYESFNKMSSNSLAIVISPCLFKHEDIDYEIYRSNLNSRIKFVEFLIEFKIFCMRTHDIIIGSDDIPEDFITSI